MESYCAINNIDIVLEKVNKFNEIELTAENTIEYYLNEISKKTLLTPEKEKELAIRIKEGDKYVREIFIESNLILVVSIDKKYSGKGLQFLDLIQEGNIGLMNAVERFDVTKGFKFSTYAT